MSLQVWLPLNGDLTNQGLSNVTITNYNATINNNGKIGKCYDFTNSQYIYTSEISGLSDVSKGLSIAGWFKLNDITTNQILFGLSGSATGNSKFRLFWGADISDFRAYVNGTWYRLNISNFSLDTFWHHYALIWDKAQVILYIDGKAVGSHAQTSFTVETTKNKLYINGTINLGTNYTYASSSYFAGSANDIRVYNHALSPKEVEEIAKGLVLHYKLDGETQVIVPPGYQQLEYLESSGTQVIDTNILPEDTYQYSFKYALREFRQYRGPFVAYTSEAANATRIMALNGSSTDIYIEFNAKASTGSLQIANLTSATDQIIEGSLSKTQYTLKNLTTNTEFSQTNSSDLFPTKGTALQNTMTLFGRIGYTSKARIYYFDTYNNSVCIQKLIPAKRLSDNTLGMYDIISHTFLTNVGTGTFIAGPNISITGLVYDSSGYSYNGTVVGSLTAAAGSPRYDIATVFDGNTAGIERQMDLSSILNSDYTISFWIKDEETDARGTIFSNYDSSPFFCIEKKSSNLLRYYLSTGTDLQVLDAALPSNTWTFVTIVRTANTKTEFYINGTLKNTWIASMPTATLSGTWRIGRDSRSGDGTPFQGQLSDFRIYATALTVAQVKELYNTSMSIDSNGNVYARELVEL